MKKLVLVLVLLFAATALFAQEASLSSLPSGSWLDSNYNGTWTFGAGGVSIKDNASGSVYAFGRSNIQDLKAVRSGVTAGISFACQDLEKTFSFFPNLTDGTILLVIERPGLEQYNVRMQKQ